MASLGLFSVLVAGEVYVSPHGSDRNAGTKEAPYLTLNRAIKQAREWRRLNRPEAAGGICICLEDGVYAQSAPLFIRPEDSGTPDSPTLIRAVENAHPVISGGVAVTGWKKGCDDPRIAKELRSKIWVAKAPSFGNRIVETRQMWVDGNKAQRAAQFPDGVMERMIDFNPEEQTIIIPASQIGNLLNARRLEMIVHQRWAIAILRVKSIDVRGEQAVIRFHEPESHLEFAHPWPQPVIGGEKGNSSFCLTNALELLDQPGEWFQEYPSGTIYYYPRSEEDMETAEVIVPALETLMIVDGTLERPVRHIRVEGITFAHTSWMRPSYQGHVTLQGGFPLLDAYKLHEPGLPEKAELENQAWIARPETAIRVRGTEHLTFSRCRFRHLASTGLDYEWAVSSSGIENCVFSDIGGTGILIGAYNYESTDEQIIINAASLRSIRTTWKDEEKVRTGKQRLAAIMYAKESGEQQKDFTLIIDDSAVYHTLNDFRSAEARKLYQQRIQKQKDYDNLKKNLDDKREQYAQGNSARKKNLTPAILELEKRTEQLLKEMAQLDISVRNEEIKKLKH